MDMNNLIAIAVGIVLIIIVRKVLMGGAPRVSGAEARKLVEEGAMLVDVRSPHEFASGKIKGSKNIPVQAISNRIAEFGPVDKPIVLCCQSGARSAMAARTLKGAGYKKLYNLGGWQNW
jgi:rhodanese-related sulfurtransferase